MLQNPRRWNEPLVKQTFLHHEDEEILSIRMPHTKGDDIFA
jgi:hypothetical protein